MYYGNHCTQSTSTIFCCFVDNNPAANSNSKGWDLGRIHDQSSDSAGFIKGLWPYWMDKNDSISNTFDLDGMFLLTAPNMSG